MAIKLKQLNPQTGLCKPKSSKPKPQTDTTNPRPKFISKKKKNLQLLKTRSIVMRNALSPPPKGKLRQAKAGRVEVASRTQTISAPKTMLLIVDDSKQRIKSTKRKRKTHEAPGMRKPRPQGGSNGQPPQSLLPYLGVINPKEACNSFGFKGTKAMNTPQKNADVIIPLTSRLPIIDFISTEEFDRLYSCKIQQKRHIMVEGMTSKKY
ncbi:GH11843 [Drosophila grimshawi]|uniref:GH11843 n=1 Tax=Drosophila grimshawi TaxID=7222 RepID=B4JLM7_DROGR|nr:GH11843 [Drosophila grimshawi]